MKDHESHCVEEETWRRSSSSSSSLDEQTLLTFTHKRFEQHAEQRQKHHEQL